MDKIDQAWRQGIIIAFISISIISLSMTIGIYIVEGWILSIQFFAFVEFCLCLVCGGLFLPTIIDDEDRDR